MKGENLKGMLKGINVRDIREMYCIKGITSEGRIAIKEENISVYKIDPANILASDQETKLKIYNAYVSCIRGLPDTFQVLISKEKANFSKQIEEYKRRLKNINNPGLKRALEKYIEYLEEISDINKLYKTNHYLLVKNLQSNECDEILTIFTNLEEFGVRIKRIKDTEEIKKILKVTFAKDVGIV